MHASTLAERARGTAFEILYARPAPPPELTKAELAAERNRTRNREHAREVRAMKKKAVPVNLHSLSKPKVAKVRKLKRPLQ